MQRIRPVRWLESATQELEMISDRISADNPRAADNLVEEIVRKTELLGEMPYYGGECPEYSRGRCIPPDNYVIYYTVHRTEVVVRAVKHGAMRFRQAWLRRKK
jgi:plasmid stabilization system protein ParE